MRRSTTHHRVLIAWLAFVAAGAGGCAATSSGESAIRSVLRSQAAAWNRGDLKAFMEGYWKSDDLTFVSVGTEKDPDTGAERAVEKTVKGWQATLDRYQSRYPTRERMGTLRFRDLVVEPTGTNAADVSGRFHLRRVGEDASGRFRLDMRRIDGAWVIVRDRTVSD